MALFLFAFEVVISSIGKRDYFLGFYFWLDLVSTISLLPDTGLIDLTDDGDGESTNQGDNTEALKAGRASKASKATRVIRLVRLVRMVRIVKLWKMHGGTEDVEEEVSVSDSGRTS